MYVILYFPGMVKPEEPEITPEVRLEWIRCYLEAKYTHFGKDPTDIPEVLVEFSDVEHAILEAVRTNWCKVISISVQLSHCVSDITGWNYTDSLAPSDARPWAVTTHAIKIDMFFSDASSISNYFEYIFADRILFKMADEISRLLPCLMTCIMELQRSINWGRDIMAAIFQTIFSSAFLWVNTFEFWVKFR